MSTTDHTFTTRRTREANAITAVLTVPCAFAVASAVVPAVEHTVTAVLLGAALLVALALVLRHGTRWLREQREDRADAVTAARWRAEHAPHLLTTADRGTLAGPVQRAPFRMEVA